MTHVTITLILFSKYFYITKIELVSKLPHHFLRVSRLLYNLIDKNLLGPFIISFRCLTSFRLILLYTYISNITEK